MSLKLRYWYRLLGAFGVRFRGIIFVGIIAGLFVFAALRFFAPLLVASKVEYIGITGRYHTEDLPEFILDYIGEGLTKFDASGQVEPALAESWEHDDEGKVWTFKLKKGLHWHDGSEVTSDTVQYQFEDAEIERPDRYTIVFKLGTPFAPFPTVVTKPTFKRGLLGTGEWKVRDLSLAGSYIEKMVLANDSGKRKVIKFYPSEDTMKQGFELGEIDTLIDVLDPHPLNTWNNVAVSNSVNSNRFVAVFFNTNADPFKGTQAKSLRQALSYAVKKTDFDGPRAYGPISPDSWAYNPQVKDYGYDVARAKDLLGGTKDLEVNLTTTPALLSVAEKIAKFWGDIGVKTNVQVVSIVPDDYQAFLAIYDVPNDPDQYNIWHSSQTQTNISKLNNPRIDTLLEDGRLELDPQERKKIYLDFQRFLLEDAPAVFLYHPLSYTITRK